MFIFTTKLNKRKAVLWLCILALILCAVIVIAGLGGNEEEAPAADLTTDSGRIAYLMSRGWQVEGTPLEQEAIIIPTDFSGVYEEYNELQKSQGFDLSKYKGESATRYTYKVLNFPNCTDTVVVDIIICNGKLIAGDVQSLALDGFMQSLEYPKE